MKVRVLYVFIDGVGYAPASESNPVNEQVCPVLFNLMQKEGIAVDACLGVPGLPQSATGQATLYTGVNAAQHMGRHKEGFPGPTLCRLLQEDNIFKALKRKGLRSCFADAYFCDAPEELEGRRFKSVTTVMSLTCPEVLRFQSDMLSGQAVLHDLSRQAIVSKGYDGPLVTPEESADHLLDIALSNDFTLFEYFLTDLAGHSQSREQAERVLRSLDAFLGRLVPAAREADLLFLLTSDHGNIEDLSTRGHTFNPVPLVVFGPHADEVRAGVRSLTDVMPRLMRVL